MTESWLHCLFTPRKRQRSPPSWSRSAAIPVRKDRCSVMLRSGCRQRPAARISADRGRPAERDRPRRQWRRANPLAQRPRRHGTGGRRLVVRPVDTAPGRRPALWPWCGRHEIGCGGGHAGHPRPGPEPGSLARVGHLLLGRGRGGIFDRGASADRLRHPGRLLRGHRIRVGAAGARLRGQDAAEDRRHGESGSRLLALGGDQRRHRGGRLVARLDEIPILEHPAHARQPLRPLFRQRE